MIDPGTAMLVGGGISGIGSLLGSFGSNSSAKKIARQQMAFQERMRDTAHQAEVRDLRLAGLNPILSATGGSGAATPSGASAPVINVGEAASKAVSSAVDSMRVKKELEIADAQIAKLRSDTNTSDTQGALNTALFNRTRQETANSALNNMIISANIPAAQNEASYQRAMGSASPWIKHTLSGLKDLLGTTHSAKALLQN